MRLSSGYSWSEIDDIQAQWQLRFPPDLIELMHLRRPLLPGGFDWIITERRRIESILRWPYEGFLFDVEHNATWWPSWGPRPEAEADRALRLTEVFAAAPKLVPLSGHRYLPETPLEPGNPVFSVYQTDVIYYGADLADWLDCEEHGWMNSGAANPAHPKKLIPFWSQAVEINNRPLNSVN